MTATEPGPGISIDASLELTLGGVRGAVERLERRLAAGPMLPVKRRYPKQVIVPASGIGILHFAGPDQGHFQYVRNIVVGGITPTTAAAGRADVYVSSADLRSDLPGLAQYGLADWRDFAGTLPNVAFYGRGELELRAGEALFVVFTSATPTQQYIGAIGVEDFQEGVIGQSFSE